MVQASVASIGSAAPLSPVIQLEHLNKVFQTDDIETLALTDIRLSIAPGEYLAIIGPSGSGKTTLLAILGLMDRPTSGRCLWRGPAVDALADGELSRLRNAHVGFIFQTFNRIGDLSVEQNVELPLVYRQLARKERRERVAMVLEQVGMTHRARHRPGQLPLRGCKRSSSSIAAAASSTADRNSSRQTQI